MMVAFRVFSLLGLFSVFASATAYTSCKEIAETVSNPVSQEYQLSVNGRLLNVFCEFRSNNIGYTFLRPVNSIDFNDIANLLAFLSNDKSDVLLKFNTAFGQYESTISPLSFYSTFTFGKQVSSFFGYSIPTTTAAYLYLGILPKALISAAGLPNGYKVNGVDYVQYTCNSLGNSYFVLDPKYGQTTNLMTPNTRPWYLNRIAASVQLPWWFFFHWTESQNCLTYEQGWALNIGLKFIYNPPCINPVAPYQANECQTRGGQCLKTSCPENVCGTLFRSGMCGGYETEYKCCLPTSPFPATCKFYGDPHISTYDGNYYDNHVPGWYYASRDCDWFWYIRAYFDNSVSPSWTIFNTMQLVVVGNTLTVDKYSNVWWNGGVLYGPVIPLFVSGISITIFRTIPSTTTTYIYTNFGVTIEIEPPIYTVLTIKLQSTWLYRTCGLCGPWDLNFANDLDNQFNSNARLNKREVEEAEEDSVIRQERQQPCLANVTAAADTYCQSQLDADSGNCGTVSAEDFKENCIFDYCIGGEEAAAYSLNSFRDDCYPPVWSTCSMCGFRQIDTFDGASYYYLGSDCEYEFANDCSADGNFSVVVVLKKQKLGGTNELLLSRVKITYNNIMIIFIRSGQVVKVDGDDVTENYASPDSDFAITFTGNLVEFRAPTLVISYNFKQMLKVEAAEEYYNKTCGLCGSWNNNTNDDLTTGDSYALDSDCEAGVGSTPCSNPAEQDAAELLCRASLEVVACKELDLDEFVERCAYEFCAGGYKMLCQHLLEALDKCFWLTGNDKYLNVTPEACKVCPPPSNRGSSGGGNGTRVFPPPSACEQKSGTCLDERCETCNAEFVDNLCTGSKKCCIPQ